MSESTSGDAGVKRKRSARMRFKNGESQSYYVTLTYAENPQTKADSAAAAAADGDDVDDNSKVPTIIYITHNPLNDSTEHNQGTATKHRFGGKNAGAPCKVQQIIGPIDTFAEAQEIQEQWKSKSRGLPGRTNQGRVLAHERNLPCFDSHYDVDYSKTAKRSARKRKNAEPAGE